MLFEERAKFQKSSFLKWIWILSHATLSQRNSFKNSDSDKIFTYLLQSLRTLRIDLSYETLAACEIRAKIYNKYLSKINS